MIDEKLIKPNWPLLGVVRFFLAFIVVTEHLGWFFDDQELLLKFTKFSPLVAVLGFLLISGFSIAASYESQRKGFYARRALRILPVYLIGIVFSVLVPVYLIDDDQLKVPEISIILGNLFFLQGILVESLNTNPIVWTLMVEVFFYLLTPFLNIKNKCFLYTVLASSALFAGQRYIGFHYFSQMLYGINMFLAWAWLLGFWLYHYRNSIGAVFFASSLGIVVIAFNGFFTPVFWTITWIITCSAVGYGHLLVMPFVRLPKILGDISYPLYLLHIPIFYCLSTYGLINKGSYYIFVAFFISLLIDLFFDKPLKKYLRSLKLCG